MCNIDLSSEEFKLSAAENFALAEVYFKTNTDEVRNCPKNMTFSRFYVAYIINRTSRRM